MLLFQQQSLRKISASSAGLDAKDLEWLANKSSMKVGYMDDMLPYSDWNEKDDKMIGLLSTFLTHMKNRYNVEFEPIRYTNYDELSEALQKGQIDAIFPVYGSFWVAEENHLMVSEPLISSYLMVARENVSNENDEMSVIAVTESSSMQPFYAMEYYPDAELLFCENMEACLKAVATGKATCTLMCSDTYYAYRNEFENLSQLIISNMGNAVSVSFATRRDDIQMYKFLKKGLASISDKTINEALISEGYANPEMSVRQFLQKHLVLVMLIFGIVLALVLAWFMYYVISSRRALKLARDNSELNEKAYIDLATGLPNRNKCEEKLASYFVISKPTACFMLDLNDLKKVNDTLGHEMGDLMILNFSKLLRKVVPLEYFVGRFGGDEFIVIAEGIEGKDEAEKLVEEVRKMIMKFNGLRGEFQISYACGYAFSEDYPDATLLDLLNEADLKMYEDKAKIKGQKR